MNCTIPKCHDFLDLKINVPAAGLRAWLEGQAQKTPFAGGPSSPTLLAFAYDGVIWGALREGGLTIANDVDPAVSPLLRDETLLEARLFNETAELYIWRDGDNQWHGRLIRPAQEGEAETYNEYIEETQILWGDQAQDVGGGFTRMSDGIQGLRHTVPLSFEGSFDERPLRLTVRHYLDPKEDFARITTSRLVKLARLNEEEQS
jgi:CRISPR-associated protein (TIGR03984 family)